MASFARSFKPPASYLSPVRRPGMPGRTISNSSDLSLTSNASGPPADDNSREQSVSAPGTPYLSGPEDEQRASSTKTPPKTARRAALGPGNTDADLAAALGRCQSVTLARPGGSREAAAAAPRRSTMTPQTAHPPHTHTAQRTKPCQPCSKSPPFRVPLPRTGAQPSRDSPDGFPFHSSRSASHSRPIAIELPKLKKLASPSSVRTPPEPLSARGDLPGGYFPNHEDPKNRVHRPHPFTNANDPRNPFILSDSAAMQADRRMPTSHPGLSSAMAAPANLPVSSYLAPGFHDAPVPMGKYYPSNYERSTRSSGQRQARHPESLPSSIKSDSQVPQYTGAETPEAETRRKMQQYQRDMIAQAAMALGGSSKAAKTGATVALNGIPLKDSWYTSSPHKPASPRLDPLGSPGPVTPMDLDASRVSYLDKGLDRLSRDGMPLPGAPVGPRSM
ncbi:hypothetical protein Purlil1_3425 [Purpureocillium lilacinum]|uniref:Uncharacterized protein n=1 Tax=Purpureocillium lilacinum TaxID=33203 RepID=A0ABR0C7J3_PURLI|nr:hypothetical protein Purlil1_3425 [Purpureocillium lilacinum]